MPHWLLTRTARLGLATLLSALGSSALACAMCLSAFKVTMSAQELVYAQRIVLVQPQGQALRVVEVIKGDVAPGSLITEHVARLDATQRQAGKSLLLIREDRWLQWVNMGAIGAEYGPWLRQLAASAPSPQQNEAAQAAQVAVLLPALESPDAMVAQIAYGAIATGHYDAMRANKAAIDVAALRRWLADPTCAQRHDLYVLLLGIAGDAQDAAAVQRHIHALWRKRDATDLSPWLVADLELGGPARLDGLARRYLFDTTRSLDEQHAAMLALGEQGNEDAAVPRAEVLRVYRRLIAQRNPAAGLAAPYLAQWQVWDAAPGYLALLKSGVPLTSASREAIQKYLVHNPHPDAKTGLAWIEATGAR